MGQHFCQEVTFILCHSELRQNRHTVLEVQERWCFPDLLLIRKGLGKGPDGLGPLTDGSVPALGSGPSHSPPYEGGL